MGDELKGEAVVSDIELSSRATSAGVLGGSQASNTTVLRLIVLLPNRFDSK
ncbi:MAG TPA: hypothetical protein VJR02_12500 [Pyrinomonadaceae bacterium]|nr:hypothetical protein [Pyrinomonadaceae bacterium]